MTDLSAEQMLSKIVRGLRANSRRFAKAAKNGGGNGKGSRPPAHRHGADGSRSKTAGRRV